MQQIWIFISTRYLYSNRIHRKAYPLAFNSLHRSGTGVQAWAAAMERAPGKVRLDYSDGRYSKNCTQQQYR